MPVRDFRFNSDVADRHWRRERESRLAAISVRIRTEASDAGERVQDGTRGKPQPVVCLDAFDANGFPMQFRTSTAAGAFAGGLRADHIRRAIVRGGCAGGFRFEWANGREVTPEDRRREKRLPIAVRRPYG